MVGVAALLAVRRSWSRRRSLAPRSPVRAKMLAMLAQVLDDLKMVSEAISHVKSIVAAIREGTDYLRARHPELRAELQRLVAELRKTILLIVDASALLTGFRFAVTATSDDREAVRFNEHFMEQARKVRLLRDQIEDLRTHCSAVRAHAQKLGDSVGISGFQSIFSRLGITAPERRLELANKLDKLAFEDFQVANGAATMFKCLDAALDDVQAALGGPGSMDPKNVPVAAALLGQYAAALRPVQRDATDTSDAIDAAIADLT
jgi:hypothetical protein